MIDRQGMIRALEARESMIISGMLWDWVMHHLLSTFKTRVASEETQRRRGVSRHVLRPCMHGVGRERYEYYFMSINSW